jgi:hypothetical protein
VLNSLQIDEQLLRQCKAKAEELVNDINQTSQEAAQNGLLDKEKYVIPPHLQNAFTCHSGCRISFPSIANRPSHILTHGLPPFPPPSATFLLPIKFPAPALPQTIHP